MPQLPDAYTYPAWENSKKENQFSFKNRGALYSKGLPGFFLVYSSEK
jgi:hypothetical protein